MTARLFSGKALALAMESDQKVRAEALPRNPALAVILVGDDPASRVYVRNKVRACERTSVRSIEILLPYETTEDADLADVARSSRCPNMSTRRRSWPPSTPPKTWTAFIRRPRALFFRASPVFAPARPRA